MTSSPHARFIDTAQSDGVLDANDNCPTVANSGQEDTEQLATITIPFNRRTMLASATVSLGGDDAVSAAIPLGFNVRSFGQVSSSVFVSTNGFAKFLTGQPNGCCSGQRLPNTATPNGLIAGFWEDLVPGSSGMVLGDCRRLQRCAEMPGRPLPPPLGGLDAMAVSLLIRGDFPPWCQRSRIVIGSQAWHAGQGRSSCVVDGCCWCCSRYLRVAGARPPRVAEARRPARQPVWQVS